MSIVLFVFTLLLDLAGVAFAAAFIWLNAFATVSDLSGRSDSVYKMAKSAMILSPVFALLSCLLSSSGDVTEAISRAAVLYLIIAISWFAVMVACGVSLFVAAVSKASFRGGLQKAVKKIFTVAIVGFCIGILMAWMLW